MKNAISRLDTFINSNTGWLIAAAIVFFGLAIVGFQKENQRILTNIQNVTTKQDQTLTAIKNITSDSRLTAQKQTAIIICMLKVPQPERSTDIEKNCRKEADAAPETNAPTFTDHGAAPTSTAQSSAQASASAPTPAPTVKLLPNCTVDVLFVHLGC